ncbi:MAG: phosphatase PAP2 family protein [Ferruginibacter sp.]
MFKQLIQADKNLFRILNGKWHNNFFDILMPQMRNAPFWLPLYLFLLLVVLINFKKTGWVWALFFFGTAALSDIISSHILKAYIIRVRPCNDPDMAEGLRFLVAYRPQSYSFTSSHAFTHFAMATFFYLTLKNYLGKWMLLVFAWAFIIAYAQVYVGVHYPIDVAGGAILGSMAGYLFGRIFNKQFGLK